MILSKLKKNITSGALDSTFARLYGEEKTLSARARYLSAIEEFARLYGDDRDAHLFSVPGRSELSGNHTDHNHGKVIAASIDLDIIAVASPAAGSVIRVKSEGHDPNCVDFDSYTFPKAELHGRSDSLIAGMVSGFKANGLAVGAFDAYTTANVLKGSGLSSSAAFEDMIGTILSHFYNNGAVDKVTIAKLAQYAENEFFGKPCGLMDQVACACGGVVLIDFADPTSPVIESLDFDITEAGYNLCIVNTGASHSDLTAEYAAVPAEMKAVAAHFGKKYLRELDRDTVTNAVGELRSAVGDRAILRAIHFFDENDRVDAQAAALKAGDIDGFFRGVIDSGNSSFKYLQNVYSLKNTNEQGISLALCLAESYLSDKRAAWRVHGGGFAGTIQAFVPSALVDEFKNIMEAAFGEGACLVLRVRNDGAMKISV